MLAVIFLVVSISSGRKIIATCQECLGEGA